jgi:hypothetical protein
MSSPRRKPEDSADGCRAFAASDRERASTAANGQVRATFERSAEAWSARASLLDRLETSLDASVASVTPRMRKRRANEDRQDGQGTEALEQRSTKSEAKVPKKSNASEPSRKLLGIRSS